MKLPLGITLQPFGIRLPQDIRQWRKRSIWENNANLCRHNLAQSLL
jgi:hypothetical protein